MVGVYCVGVAVEDLVFQVETMPTQPEKYLAKDMEVIGGGCAATAAAAIAHMGGRAALACRIGDDLVGNLIVSELRDYGVDCDDVRQFAGKRSSGSAIFVDEAGERLIMNYRDDGLPASGDWLPDPTKRGCNVVLADSRWPTGAAAAFEHASYAGIPAVLDADSPMAGDDLIRKATHVAFSAQGLRHHAQSDDLLAGLAEMRTKTDAWLCVTDGSGAVLIDSGKDRLALQVSQVDVVDTLGAGDVWHGAFALVLSEGKSARDAVEFASAAATLKCTRFGGRKGTPSRKETLSFLHQRGPGQFSRI